MSRIEERPVRKGRGRVRYSLNPLDNVTREGLRDALCLLVMWCCTLGPCVAAFWLWLEGW